MPNILIEDDIALVILEIFNTGKFQKSDVEIETYVSKEELKYPQEYEDWGNIILDDLNQKEMNDPREQAMFKLSRRNNSYSVKIITICQNELLEPIEISVKFLEEIIQEMSKISIKKKQYGYDTQRIQIINIYLLD